jgi:transcriptional regulator with XRE-family HTH domain
MESLGEYLDRVMRQKNLTAKELARRCNVTNSYIARVRKGAAGNLTVQTMTMLAEGLGVNPHDIFTAASGFPAGEAERVDALALLDHLQKLIQNPAGFDILQQCAGLSSEKQKPLLDFVASLNQQPSKTRKKPRKQ